mgnify:FL=1
MSFADEVKGKKVLVFGLGLQGGGVGDALWLIKHGATVRVTDLKSEDELEDSLAKLPDNISHSLGQHLDEDIEWADIIIKNPGVPDSQPQITLARELGKPVFTSIALVVKEARDKTIGITGTRGKSTTTELTYSLLNSLFPGEIIKGGNIPGTSGLQLLDQLADVKYLVLELSSFQLTNFHDHQLSPRYSILTNIYPDHLNRYEDMEAYQHDKSAIYAYQNSTDFLIYNQTNQIAASMASSAPGKLIPFESSTLPDLTLQLPGEHNKENVAAVYELAKILDLDLASFKEVAEEFSSVPFRLELIRELDGVRYYNDSTSTTPTATIKALSSFSSPTVLILGGDQKHLPTDDLITALKDSLNLTDIILLGSHNIPEFTSKLTNSCGDLIRSQVNSMVEAVSDATSAVQEGGIVLLSPGFASFDLFENEFDRGRQFNQAVKSLNLISTSSLDH